MVRIWALPNRGSKMSPTSLILEIFFRLFWVNLSGVKSSMVAQICMYGGF